MSPLEKAQQLKESFNNSLTAKDCCIICVDEILSINSVDKDEDLSNYWEQVKQEIENL
jgi:hypothetical protein